MKLGPVEISRRERALPEVPPAPTITMAEALDKYEVIDITPQALIVVDPRGQSQRFSSDVANTSATTSFGEIGYSGNTLYGSYLREEYNPELRGYLGLHKFDQMRRSDSQVRMSLRLVKTPILAARWYIQPASTSKQDIKVAEFVNNCLNKYMSMSWPQLLTEILCMLDFGWYAFEKVFALRNNQIIWQKLAPRHPMDISRWSYDVKGGPQALNFHAPNGGDEVSIPISKLLVFTYDKEAGNMEGISVLRSAYKHWYLKENMYKIDAIQKERHGIGIPVIKLPPNFSPTDKSLANEMGRNLRTNEKAHIVLPPMWELEFADIKGNPVDLIASIEHHDIAIARNVLGQFMNFQRDGQSDGSSLDIFMKATRFVAEIIRDVFNKWAIPELVDFNWKTVNTYPELKVRRIGDTVDWRTISFAMRNFIGANVIKPDDQLEAFIRNEMDLPAADTSTTRETATPQAPKPPTAPVAGPPRQSTAANNKQGQNTGGTNSGTDKSGG